MADLIDFRIAGSFNEKLKALNPKDLHSARGTRDVGVSQNKHIIPTKDPHNPYRIPTKDPHNPYKIPTKDPHSPYRIPTKDPHSPYRIPIYPLGSLGYPLFEKLPCWEARSLVLDLEPELQYPGIPHFVPAASTRQG